MRVGTVYATDAMFFVPSFASITLTHAGRYPWAIAPTINTTKLVATAIATFVSTDKFISPPFVPGVTVTPSFEIFPFGIASNLSALTDAKTKS